MKKIRKEVVSYFLTYLACLFLEQIMVEAVEIFTLFKAVIYKLAERMYLLQTTAKENNKVYINFCQLQAYLNSFIKLSSYRAIIRGHTFMTSAKNDQFCVQLF